LEAHPPQIPKKGYYVCSHPGSWSNEGRRLEVRRRLGDILDFPSIRIPIRPPPISGEVEAFNIWSDGWVCSLEVNDRPTITLKEFPINIAAQIQ
jgi:hypothetical protein